MCLGPIVRIHEFSLWSERDGSSRNQYTRSESLTSKEKKHWATETDRGIVVRQLTKISTQWKKDHVYIKFCHAK